MKLICPVTAQHSTCVQHQPEKVLYFLEVRCSPQVSQVRVIGVVMVPLGVYIRQGAFSGWNGTELVRSWVIGLAVLPWQAMGVRVPADHRSSPRISRMMRNLELSQVFGSTTSVGEV